MTNTWDAVYTIVRQIPAGKVATYGQISKLMNSRISAAAVGWALHVCPADVPWHRVINSKGKLSKKDPDAIQSTLLLSEGVVFDDLSKQSLSLKCYQWEMPVL